MVKAAKDFKIYILGVELLLAVPFSDCDEFCVHVDCQI